MRMLVCWIAFLGMIVSAGCQAEPLDAAAPPEAAPGLASTPLPGSSAQETAAPERITPMTKLPERVPPAEVTTPVVGEVPMELLDSILQDLAERTGAAPEEIVVTQAQAIVWNDGSLGCPQPGMFYTQALVDGYRVILEVEGQKYDYRVAESGYFFPCEAGSPPLPPQSTPPNS